MGYNDVPAKVLEAFVVSQVGYGAWPHDDGTNDPYWKYGETPKDCFWELVLEVTPQTHSSHKTRQPKVYNGMDVKIGDYIASTLDGVSVKIIRIDRKVEGQITCIVEDVFRYNTYRDAAGLGNGLFSIPGSALIFELNETGLPIVDPLPANTVGPAFYPNLMSRFQNVEQSFNFILEQTNHEFEVGQLVSADADTQTFVLTDNDHPYMIGTVSFINGPDHFTINPIQKIIDDLDKLDGEIGSILYADEDTPGAVTLDLGTNPVMIKLRDFTLTEVEGVIPDGVTTPGNAIVLNGVNIAIGGTGTIGDLVSAINVSTNDHGVTASEIPVQTRSETVQSILNTYYGEPLLAIPTTGPKPSAVINGVTVVFQTSTDGMMKYGQTLSTPLDMAIDINAMSIPYIEAKAEAHSLILVQTGGAAINIQNVTPDARGNPFAGTGSASGLRLSQLGTGGQKIARLLAADARQINIANDIGDPLADFGLYSVENGIKAAALYIEQGVRTTTSKVVVNITGRDSLPAIIGDQAYVLDKGDGEWGLYLYDGSDWQMISSAETAKVDANTYVIEITNADSLVEIGEVNAGSKVTQITVEVTEAFNGGASIAIGDDDLSNRLVSDDQVDITSVGTYIVSPSFVYPDGGGDVTLYVYLVATMATTGVAQITVNYQ